MSPKTKQPAGELKGAEFIVTDPRDPKFFAGTTVERKLSALKYIAPSKYDAFDVIVLHALRLEFLNIGPDPDKARRGGA